MKQVKLSEMQKKGSTLATVTRSRSFTKALSYRFFGTIASFGITYAITHKGSLAALAALLDVVIKICIYYAHERVWNRIKWGRKG
jgi:adenylylsulfate kinase